jgi:hypothetical protein
MPLPLLSNLAAYGARRGGYFDPRYFRLETATPMVGPASLIGIETPSTASHVVLSTGFQIYNDGPFDITGDFCVEFYFSCANVSNGATKSIYYMSAGNVCLYISSSGNFTLIVGGGNSGATPAATSGVMYHFAHWRIGSTNRIALNGSILWTFSSSMSGQTSVTFGYSPYATNPPNSEFAQFKATSGNSRYGTSNFAAPMTGLGFSAGADALWANVPLASDFTELPRANTSVPAGINVQYIAQYPKPPNNRAFPQAVGSRGVMEHAATFAPEYTGDFKIVGIVNVDDDPDYPVARRVRLYTQDNGRFVAETWSQEGTGFYIFDYIRGDRKYYITAEDYNHVFNAVINDNVSPEPR